MNLLYRYPGAGYALLWPFALLGADYTRAAAFAGVGVAAVAKGPLPAWAARIDAGTRVHLPAMTRRDALACVADLAARGATRVELYQGARMRADGRVLWAATDTFSREPGPEILAPTGVVIKAKLDPLRAGDFRHITSLAAGDLASTDREAGLPAVNRFVDRISDLDPNKGIGAFTDKLKAAAAKLRSDQGKLNQAWVKTADKHFTSVTKDTRRSVKNRFMGGLAVDISQPQVNAVERLVEQQGWFVRGMDGQRNDALTAQARKIVASGLAQGLGRTQIGAEMREKLPAMWQGMGKAYANTVAANGLARARSHAELSSYKEGGIQYAEVVAMLDERTTSTCFFGNTSVLTPDGNCPISYIKPGDRVITGCGLVRRVCATIVRTSDHILHVRLSSGGLMSVTENHPILTPDGWVRAGMLRSGGAVAEGIQESGRVADDDVPALREGVRGADDLCGAGADALLFGSVPEGARAQGPSGQGAHSDLHCMREGLSLPPGVRHGREGSPALLHEVSSAPGDHCLRGMRQGGRADGVDCETREPLLFGRLPGAESRLDGLREVGGRCHAPGADELPARGPDRAFLCRLCCAEIEASDRGGRRLLARCRDGARTGAEGLAGAQGGGHYAGWLATAEDRWQAAHEGFPEGQRGEYGAHEIHPRVYLERCRIVTVTDIQREVGFFRVYNLEVDDDPTYVAAGIVVHNCRLMDGQLIPVDGALGLANQASTVSTPEDIGRVSPFLRERRNDQGTLEIRAGSKVLGAFDRPGTGRADDRGQARQFTAGSGFIGAKVGAPPYHHNCRTTLVPRMDVAQVPQGYAVRATGPSPAGVGDVLSFGAIEQFKMPTASMPVTTGTLSPIDNYGIPEWTSPPQGVQTAIASDPQALGVRVMGAQPTQRGFDTSAPWERVSQREVATARATLATANDAIVQVLHTGSPRQVAGAMLANQASSGREQLVQLRDAKGRAVWARFTGRSNKALDSAAEAVRLATTPSEAAVASEALLNAAIRAGTVRIGDTVEAVASPKGDRVTAGTSGVSARSPRKGGGGRATAEQPQRGTKRGGGASPMTDEPADPYNGTLRKSYAGAGPTVFSARPDGAVIARESWTHGRGSWSSAAVDVNGNALNRKAWESIPVEPGVTAQTALSVVRPRPSDRIVNAVVTRALDPKRPQTRRYIVSALEAERATKHGADRDWILSDDEGSALFLRIDGSRLSSLRKDAFAEAADSWVRSGSVTDLGKLGAQLEDTLESFYLSARIDWQQRNLIAGVPISVQVERRVATVRDEVQSAIRSQEGAKGRALTTSEKGAIVQRMVRDGAATVKPSDVLPDRTEDLAPDALRSATELDRARSGINSVMNLQRGAIYRRAVDLAFAPCSDAVLQAVSAMGAPRLYYAPGFHRTIVIEHNILMGEHGAGAAVVVPRDVDKLLRGSTPSDHDDKRALRHAVAHLYGLAGQTDVAARVARNSLARDVSSVRVGDIDVYGRDGGLVAVAIPGAYVSPYDARVYGQDAARIRKLIGKPLEARALNDPSAVNEQNARIGQEFLGTAVERLDDAVAIGTNWEVAPDQVAFMISALRGHYVPH